MRAPEGTRRGVILCQCYVCLAGVRLIKYITNGLIKYITNGIMVLIVEQLLGLCSVQIANILP